VGYLRIRTFNRPRRLSLHNLHPECSLHIFITRALDGQTLPKWDKSILEKFPEGYRYLGVAQEMIGHDMLYDLRPINNKEF
jgi:hypothetical protein